VAVTGLGVVCSLGRGQEAFLSALSEGRRDFRAVTLFDPGNASRAPVAQVAGFEEGRRERPTSRLERMAAAAGDEALAGAGLEGSPLLRDFGIALASVHGGMLETEAWFAGSLAGKETGESASSGSPSSAASVLRLPPSACTDLMAARYGLRGPRLTNTTACSSSAGSIAAAAERIRLGEVPGMLAGGGDELCRLTFAGFASLRSMDPEGCRPFQKGRKGLTLGEGAGILILENRDLALERGARPLAELRGYGASCDAYHMTGCHPEGRGMEAAIREALEGGEIQPEQIDYVNAHGTATPINDSAEAKAVERVFGDVSTPALSSTKSMHGHLLGGSGAVEAVATVLCISRGVLPPTAGVVEPDDGMNLDLIKDHARRKRIRFAISNSFGFGGGNLVLLFAAAEERSAEPA
jgi:3-oxoacyl-[acyl-carrier-protein] synthase II